MANLLVTLMDKMDVPVEHARRQHRQAADRHALRVSRTMRRLIVLRASVLPLCFGARGWRWHHLAAAGELSQR